MNANVVAPVLLSILVSVALPAAQDDLPRAVVHVEATGPFGSEIRPSVTHIRLLTKERKLAVEGKGTKLVDVPYGAYILSVWDDGGGYGEREVAVNTNEVWVRIGLVFPTGNHVVGGSLTISGSVLPRPRSGKQWWVRIDGVFLHVTKEGPVSPDGRFSVGGLVMGAYLVEVFDGPLLLGIDTIEIDPNTPDRHIKLSISANGLRKEH